MNECPGDAHCWKLGLMHERGKVKPRKIKITFTEDNPLKLKYS